MNLHIENQKKVRIVRCLINQALFEGSLLIAIGKIGPHPVSPFKFLNLFRLFSGNGPLKVLDNYSKTR